MMRRFANSVWAAVGKFRRAGAGSAPCPSGGTTRTLLKSSGTGGLLAAAIVVGLTAATPARADEKLDEAQKAIVKKFEDVKSITAKLTRKLNQEQAGAKMVVDGSGTYELVRGGDEVMYRIEMSENTVVSSEKMQGLKMSSTQSVIFDGKAEYTLKSQLGNARATRDKMNAARHGVPKQAFEELATSSTVALLPDAKIDGKDAYAIEATPKSPRPGSLVAKTVYYYDKGTGVLLKWADLTKDGQEAESLALSDIKLGDKIEKERFVFKAPDGVEVTDAGARRVSGRPAAGPAPTATKPAQPPASASAPTKP